MATSIPKTDYFSGLDLGQANEFTAFAVVERTTKPDPTDRWGRKSLYAVRHLERFPLGTTYGDICGRMATRFGSRELVNSTLVVDQTTVGKPVVELLRRGRIRAKLQPVTITAGLRFSPDDGGGWLVPKKELVSTLQMLLQSRGIKIVPTLPQAQLLLQELTEFRVKTVLAGPESLDEWRERSHDDLVLAVAIAVWEGERCRPTITCAPTVISLGPDCGSPYRG